MEVCHHRKSEEDILALASFADRQLEYDTHYHVFPCWERCFFPFQRAFGMLSPAPDFCSCFLKRNFFHPDRACYLATRLPVVSGTSFLRSLDDTGKKLTFPYFIRVQEWCRKSSISFTTYQLLVEYPGFSIIEKL